MVSMSTAEPTLAEMIAAITKTFVIAHAEDSDAHLAQALVYNAGRLAWRMREQGVQVDQKTSITDVVTDADRAAETFIAGALEALRPEDGILGEEGAGRESTSGRNWVVDPVDGTFNFTRGSDYWCSALALIEGPFDDPKEVLLGAVHRPAMGYTWFGGADYPTQRDSQKVTPLTPKPLAACAFGTYLHPTWMDNAEVRETWLRAARGASTLRMHGAGSVDLASVADGTLDLWMQHSVPAWDWLPGRALVEAAGGTALQVAAGGVTWSVAGNEQAVREVEALLLGGSVQ